jgi:hypothetical protein
MQVAGNKTAAILGVSDKVSFAKAKARTIGIVKVSAKVRIAVSTEAGINVNIKAEIMTIKEIKRTDLIKKGFKR